MVSHSHIYFMNFDNYECMLCIHGIVMQYLCDVYISASPLEQSIDLQMFHMVL